MSDDVNKDGNSPPKKKRRGGMRIPEYLPKDNTEEMTDVQPSAVTHAAVGAGSESGTAFSQRKARGKST